MAGSMWALAEACGQQRIVNCPCMTSGTEPTDSAGNVIFYKCDDNVDYAMNFIKMFAPLERPGPNSDINTKIKYMNSILGINVSQCWPC